MAQANARGVVTSVNESKLGPNPEFTAVLQQGAPAPDVTVVFDPTQSSNFGWIVLLTVACCTGRKVDMTYDASPGGISAPIAVNIT